MAMLEIENNEEWKRIGGRLILMVHDETIAEVPIQYWKEGGEILSKCMCDAADFLPFPSKCDVTTTMRWYGLEYPCPYTKPEHMDDNWTESLNEDEIKWIQYHLYDLEYELPIFKDAEGNKPRGDAAVGVNGIVSDELIHAVTTYLDKRKIGIGLFPDDIEYRVINGIYRN